VFCLPTTRKKERKAFLAELRAGRLGISSLIRSLRSGSIGPRRSSRPPHRLLDGFGISITDLLLA
jgi:hypothetical protein